MYLVNDSVSMAWSLSDSTGSMLSTVPTSARFRFFSDDGTLGSTWDATAGGKVAGVDTPVSTGVAMDKDSPGDDMNCFANCPGRAY